jgi:hypothetical protein
MTESEMRVAITGPAETAGLRIDPALTDTILGDLRVAGALPLLPRAMALTWEQRDDDRLTPTPTPRRESVTGSPHRMPAAAQIGHLHRDLRCHPPPILGER